MPKNNLHVAVTTFFIIILRGCLFPLGCIGTRIVSWPVECPEIGKIGSDVLSVVGTHSHKFTKFVDMQACLNGEQEFNCGGFAALLADKVTIWTWGAHGSQCYKKQSPSPVLKIVTTDSAFAVLSESGDIVMAWGSPEHGGILPRNVNLKDMKDLYSNPYAFVGLKNNGECIAWGDKRYGGEISHDIREEISANSLGKIHTIIPATYAFAALKSINGNQLNNTVISWGDPDNGGRRIVQNCWPDELKGDELIRCENRSVPSLLKNVKSLVANGHSFIAFMNTPGYFESFGFREFGGDCAKDFSCQNMQDCSDDNMVIRIIPSIANFVGLTKSGRVISCGKETWGWNAAKDSLNVGVSEVVSTHGAFAALRMDKTVVTWGDRSNGGDSRKVKTRLKNIKSVVGNILAFAALRQDGEVVVWGNALAGGDIEIPVKRCYVRYRRSMNGNALVHIWVKLEVKDIEKIYPGSEAFAAVRKDQSIITWGDKHYGAGLCMSYFTETDQAEDQMQDWEKIIHIVPSFSGFAAQIQEDESLRATILEERRQAEELANQKEEVVVGSKGSRNHAVAKFHANRPIIKTIAIIALTMACVIVAG